MFNPQNLPKTVKCDGVSGMGSFRLGVIRCNDYFVCHITAKEYETMRLPRNRCTHVSINSSLVLPPYSKVLITLCTLINKFKSVHKMKSASRHQIKISRKC